MQNKKTAPKHRLSPPLKRCFGARKPYQVCPSVKDQRLRIDVRATPVLRDLKVQCKENDHFQTLIFDFEVNCPLMNNVAGVR